MPVAEGHVHLALWSVRSGGVLLPAMSQHRNALLEPSGLKHARQASDIFTGQSRAGPVGGVVNRVVEIESGRAAVVGARAAIREQQHLRRFVDSAQLALERLP